MTTPELRAYIEANGMERALEKYEHEPTDNPAIAALFDDAAKIMQDLDNAMAKLEAKLETTNE